MITTNESVHDALESSRPLPPYDLLAAELGTPVHVALGLHGVPTIYAHALEDAVVALGYMVARDRLGQMDLTRRKMAGRLSELFGSSMIDADCAQRRYGFSRIAVKIFERLPARHALVLERYCVGVNLAIRQQPTPFEHALLGAEVESWAPSDCLLVALGLAQTLADDGIDGRMEAVMRATLPLETVDAMLESDSDPFATSIDGVPVPSRRGPLPDDLINRVRSEPSVGIGSTSIVRPARPALGSNAWATGGAGRGPALLANDMHLELAAPNVWYRVALRVRGRRFDGVTLPGVPVFPCGTSAHVAWGVTSLPAVTTSLVDFPSTHEAFRDGADWRPFDRRVETIKVRGSAAKTITVLDTPAGPVLDPIRDGKATAVKWIALDPTATDLGLIDLLDVEDIETARDIFTRAGIPPMTAVIAGVDGRVAWTLAGKIPCFGQSAASSEVSADNSRAWEGVIPPYELPGRIGTDTDTVVSANNVPPEFYHPGIKFNGHGGQRARRIATLLAGGAARSPRAMHAIQVDTDARLYAYYKALAIEHLRGTAAAKAAVRRLQRWDGTSQTQSQGLALLVLFRSRLREVLFGAALAACRRHDDTFEYCWHDSEGVLRRMLDAGLYTADAPHFPGFLETRLAEADDLLWANSDVPADADWGALNRAAVSHPLSQIVGDVAPLLDMPATPLAGCTDSVCVATPTFGASVRLAVSAGDAASGLIAVPGGQSGHPLETSFNDSFETWAARKSERLLDAGVLSRFKIEPTDNWA